MGDRRRRRRNGGICRAGRPSLPRACRDNDAGVDTDGELCVADRGKQRLIGVRAGRCLGRLRGVRDLGGLGCLWGIRGERRCAFGVPARCDLGGLAAVTLLADPAVSRGRALGTDIVVATTDPRALEAARALVDEEVAAVDRACSRFRVDSEIWALERANGRSVVVSQVLADALASALWAAELTAGAVDLSVGNALVSLGYDRDFTLVGEVGGGAVRPSPALGWWSVTLDPVARTVEVPSGLLIDLGATGKAFAADRAAARCHDALRTGVLVSLGGDIAVAGPPPEGGWTVGIALSSGDDGQSLRQRVALHSGGLATSCPQVRSWRRGGRLLHHIVDPLTGEPASDHWRLASVAAPTCVEANALSTAAIVWGAQAPDRLGGPGVAARLEHRDGHVDHVGAWPLDERHDGTACPVTEAAR